MSHIWIPKLKIIEPPPLVMGAGKVEGFFQLDACNRYGQSKRSLRWKQLITDFGMTEIANRSAFYHNFVSVGVGSPTFTNASTGLASFTARTNTAFSTTTVNDTVGTDGYRVRETKTWQFALGAVVANLSEVGSFITNNNISGVFLDLIRDSGGLPTTFPVTAEDQLRVTHVLDVYPYLGDHSGTFNIGGSAGSGNHDWVSRAQNVQSSSNVVQKWLGTNEATGATATAHRDVTSGNLGTVTQSIGGISITGNSTASNWSSSSNDGTTWTVTWSPIFGLTAANHANGISGLSLSLFTKMLIDPAIPKFAGSIQRILTLNVSAGLTRA